VTPATLGTADRPGLPGPKTLTLAVMIRPVNLAVSVSFAPSTR
jgi:hypothetical protein